MKATVAVLTAPRTIEFIQEALPAIGENDMLIKMDAVGLCHSDLPGYTGAGLVSVTEHGYRKPGPATYPARFGHEAVGTVLETGKNVRRFKVGGHVSGRMRQCFRDYAVIENADELTGTVMLFPLPDMEQDFRTCVTEPMECAVNIVRFANPEYGENVAVVGCGIMGLLTIAGLRKSGAKRLVAVDLLADKLELAKKLGASAIMNPREIDDIAEWSYKATDGRFFDVVVEVTGSIKGLDTAAQLIRYGHKNGNAVEVYQGPGRILLPSVYAGQEVFPTRLGYNLMVRAPTMQVVHTSYSIEPLRNEMFAIDAFIDRTMPLDELITHRVPFEELAAGMEWLIKPPAGYVKGICTFE